MARQECNNTFSDGLIMDLNPINTPKSVLTDCLNGTYITYNGNEFVLQNDMGNYKLKNCKLPTNFIPVGVKGYGDILYIVSYNPITNETEIGSYPAPQSIFTTGDSDAKIADTDDLAPFTWREDDNLAVEYPTIIKENKKPIFIFTDSNEETYKLNPGDEFKFSGELTPLDFIYQHLNFYIIDEDNKLYDIDDTQIYKEDGSLVSQEMRKVFWETPGWLAAQYDLYVPDKFNLNLRSLNVPEFLTAKSNNGASQADGKPLDELEPGSNQFKVSMDLSSQTIITDRLFQNELNKNFGNISDDLNDNMSWKKNPANVYNHLYIRYLIKQNQNPPKEGEDDYGTFKGIVVSIDDTHTQDYTNGVTEGDYVYYDIPVWKHNYQDDIITAYNNIRPIWFCKEPDKNKQTGDLDIANYHGVVELTAYPIIKYNGLTLKYTQFNTTQRFPLNTLKNSSDITIADQIYKWSVDDDSCTISFNINGPFINASDITGRYSIQKIIGNSPTLEDCSLNSIEIPNLILYGQNTININFNDKFQDEKGVYIFHIILNQNNSKLYETTQILIPSRVFNEWFGQNDNYLTELTISNWINKWFDYINLNSYNISNLIPKFKSINIPSNGNIIDLENFVQYKWRLDTDFKTIHFTNDNWNDNPNSKTVYLQKLETSWKRVISELLSEHLGSTITSPCVLTSETNDMLTFKFNWGQLIDYITIDGNVNLSVLNGWLWTPDMITIYYLYSSSNNNIKYSFSKQTIEEEQVEKEEFRINKDAFENLAQEISITFTNLNFEGSVSSQIYPFRSGYTTTNSLPTSITMLGLKTLEYDNRNGVQVERWWGSQNTKISDAKATGRANGGFAQLMSTMNSKNYNMILGGCFSADGRCWTLAGDAGNDRNFSDDRLWSTDVRWGVFVRSGIKLLDGSEGWPCVYFIPVNYGNKEDSVQLFTHLYNVCYDVKNSISTKLIKLVLSDTPLTEIRLSFNRIDVSTSVDGLYYTKNGKFTNGSINNWINGSPWNINDNEIQGMHLINEVPVLLTKNKDILNNILSSNVPLVLNFNEITIETISIKTIVSAFPSAINSINSDVDMIINTREEEHSGLYLSKNPIIDGWTNVSVYGVVEIFTKLSYDSNYKIPEYIINGFGNNQQTGEIMNEYVWYNGDANHTNFILQAGVADSSTTLTSRSGICRVAITTI